MDPFHAQIICQDLPRKLQESGALIGDWQVICSLLQDSFFNHETFVALSDVGSWVRPGRAKLKLRNARAPNHVRGK